jgi:dTDP-4-dehydrorhamnose 3,5-epimerase
MAKFKFTRLEMPEVILIQPQKFADSRGFFSETYNKQEFAAAGITDDFVQDNHSYSTADVIRGLHFSLPPNATAKLVRCLEGSVLDVAVDVRAGSPTFGKYVSRVLSAENGEMLYIPAGFAHGFAVLSGSAHFLYKVTKYYVPEHDRGVRWDDPDIGIEWGIRAPILSAKDAALPFLKDASR